MPTDLKQGETGNLETPAAETHPYLGWWSSPGSSLQHAELYVQEVWGACPWEMLGQEAGLGISDVVSTKSQPIPRRVGRWCPDSSLDRVFCLGGTVT